MANLNAGTTGYPGTLDTSPDLTDGSSGDEILSAHHDGRGAAIVAVETELGTDPAGSTTDVKTRLAVALNDDGTVKSAVIVAGGSTSVSYSGGVFTITVPATLTSVAMTQATITSAVLRAVTLTTVAPSTPGASVLYSDSIVKGWARFQVDGTIDDDLNVSSITDNGIGDWTVNWATAFASTTYAVVVTPQNSPNSADGRSGTVDSGNPPTTTACRVLTMDAAGTGVARDPTGTNPRVHVIAIGDQ